MGEIPAGVTVVSESGIADAEQLQRLRASGVEAVLVGESLMRSADPERRRCSGASSGATRFQ